uniref:DUF302 domain-containing protein n=1 Tax=Persicitalea sp. TaxID=3100273 RepID=UPI0035932980
MKLFTKYLFTFAIGSLFFSCQDHNVSSDDKPDAPGLAYSESAQDFDATYNSLQSALKSNPDISIVAEVNHTANAKSVNLELRPTRVILFGNPTIGTPLMQANQLAGLDLPQKMLVYQAANDKVFVAYNS